MMQIATTPSSWRNLEFDLSGNSPHFRQVLSEIKEIGYAGIELGEWGFLPTNAFDLRQAVQEFDLMLLGAFIPVSLSNPDKIQVGMERALEAASLIYNAGFEDALVILSDEYGSVDERTNHAGRITEELGMSEETWSLFISGAEKIASEIKRQFALRTVFHPHCGGYVETPGEVDQFLLRSDPSLLGLCLDVGHYSFGGGDPVEALKKHYDRIWHIHFKDINSRIDEEAAKNGYNYFKSVEEGVFCEIGMGKVDFHSLMAILKEKKYDRWIVLDQDLWSGSDSPKNLAQNNLNYIKKLL